MQLIAHANFSSFGRSRASSSEIQELLVFNSRNMEDEENVRKDLNIFFSWRRYFTYTRSKKRKKGLIVRESKNKPLIRNFGFFFSGIQNTDARLFVLFFPGVIVSTQLS